MKNNGTTLCNKSVNLYKKLERDWEYKAQAWPITVCLTADFTRLKGGIYYGITADDWLRRAAIVVQQRRSAASDFHEANKRHATVTLLIPNLFLSQCDPVSTIPFQNSHRNSYLNVYH